MMMLCRPSLVFLIQPRSGGGGPTQPVVMWIIVLIGVALVGGTLILLFRRHLFAKDADQAQHGTMMESLRAMRNAGQISSTEYDTMRRNMVEAIRNSTTGGKLAPPTVAAPLRSLPSRPQPPADRIARPGFDLTGARLPKPPGRPPTPPE